MKLVVYPGTFDPVTNGHIDIVKRAIKLFDKIIVSVAINRRKTPTFSLEERLEMLEEEFSSYDTVEVSHFEGLLADYLRDVNAAAVIRGLRAISDFEFEFQIALMNRKLNKDVETVFLTPAQEYIHLNSTIVREVASYNGDVSEYVPPHVLTALKNKYNN